MADPLDIDKEVMHEEQVRETGHEPEHELPALAEHDADPLETEDVVDQEELHSEDADGVHGDHQDELAMALQKS